MILQEELVSYALSSSGQIYVPPRTLRFGDDMITRNILEPVAGEYAVFRPPLIWEHVFVSVNGWPIPPKVRRVVSLRALYLFYWPYSAAIALRPIPRMLGSRWFITEGMLYAPPGRYELEYLSNNGYTVTHTVAKHEAYQNDGVNTRLKFFLRCIIRPGTLKLYLGDSPHAATDDGNGNIVGPFTTVGVIDYQTSEVRLTLTAVTTLPLQAEFFSENPGVAELDWKEVWFRDLFTARFLLAYATARSVMRIEGLPVDLNTDGLVDYARTKEEKWDTLRTEKNSWYRW